MSERGHLVSIVAQPKSALLRCAQEKDMSVFSMPMNWWVCGWMFFQLLKVIKRQKIQIIVTHGSIDSWVGGMAGRLSSQKPWIIRARHKTIPITNNWRHRLLYRQLPHGVMTTGEVIRQGLIRDQALPPSTVISIPTGVDLKVFSRKRMSKVFREEIQIEDSACIIGTVAFLRRYKGVHVCVKAVEKLVNAFPHLVLIVVGEGPEAKFLKAQVRELGLERHVRFIGFRADIPHILAALDIFVLASLEGEGIPQALLQAMAMEVPVVATSVGGIPEVVVHEHNGFLIPPDDASALYSRLSVLVENTALQKEIGQRGKLAIEAEYSLEGMVKKIEEWYVELTGVKR